MSLKAIFNYMEIKIQRVNNSFSIALVDGDKTIKHYDKISYEILSKYKKEFSEFIRSAALRQES